MKRFTHIMTRCALIALIAGLSFQFSNARKAEAIADPATSAGAACFFECNDVFDECDDRGYAYSQCYQAQDYCDFTCVEFGAPFTLWWLFVTND